MNKLVQCYKLARPDGWDFYTGHTINYRGDGIFPHVVKCPKPNSKLGVCSSGVIHASLNPSDCFVGARIPCSAYKVAGHSLCGTKEKYGFTELTVLKEIADLDTLFGWRYEEACNPLNPLRQKRKPTEAQLELLRQWDSVWASVRDSVGDSVWASVRASVRDSVRDSVWAYIGYLFGSLVKSWKYIKHEPGQYPFQPAVDLWKAGLVPSYDGKTWRLHSGKKATIVYEADDD